MAEGNTIGTLVNQSSPNSSGGDTNPPEEKSWWDSIKEYVHTGLDIAAAIPVAGAIFDGLNGAIYTAEGDYGNAAISFSSAALDFVPGVGSLAKGGKYAYKITKSVLKVSEKTVATQLEKTVAKQLEKNVAKQSEKSLAKQSEKETAETIGNRAAKKDDGISVKDKKNEKSVPSKVCPKSGHPVNPVLGCKFLTEETELDFRLPSVLPLLWQRSYFSDQSGNGWLGQGWSLPFSWRLLQQTNSMLLIDYQGREIKLPKLAEGMRIFEPNEQLFFARERNSRYRISTIDNRAQYIFSPLALGDDDPQGIKVSYFPLTAVQDEYGNHIRLCYEDNGLPTNIYDAAGRWLKLHFITLTQPDGNEVHRLQSVTQLSWDADCKDQRKTQHPETLVTYRYSDDGDLIGVYAANGDVIREYRYKNHILIEHSQPGGLVARYEYDEYTIKGKVVRHTTNLGQTWLFDYRVNETWVTDPIQRVTRYQYNADKELTGVISGNEQTIQKILDKFGRQTTLIKPGGLQTHYEYNSYGMVTAVTDAAGNRIAIRYNLQHRPIAIIDAMGHATRYEYNSAGSISRQINPLGHITEYTYNERGLVTEIKSHDGKIRQMEYNAAGLLVTYTDCSGFITRFGHDTKGNVNTLSTADGTTLVFTYDFRGKLLTTSFADGSSNHYTYDRLGRQIGKSNGLSAKTAWQLDVDGLPLIRTDACGNNFCYQYDNVRRLVGLTNENGANYYITYDNNDRIIREKGFDGTVTNYRYNDAGQLFEKYEFGSEGSIQIGNSPNQGIKTIFNRDKLGRVIEKITCDEKNNLEMRNYYQYNKNGFLIKAYNTDSIIERSYNEINQLMSETCKAFGYTQTLLHSYDSYGNRCQTILPSYTKLDYFYYGPGHLLQINVDGEVLCEMERDSMHRTVSCTQGELISHFQYSPLGQLQHQQVLPQTSPKELFTPIISRTYQYDRAGNLQSISSPFDKERNYQYDALNRILKAGDEVFAFDPAHNLIENASSKYANRVIDNRLSGYQNCHYSYDLYGNLREKTMGKDSCLLLHYNPEHQLERAEMRFGGNHMVTKYNYDALGRRIYKKSTHEAVFFLWDDNQLLSEIKAGQTTTFLYEPGTFSPLVQIVQKGTSEKDIYYYHTDQVGAPYELTTMNGQIVWRAHYKVWGKVAAIDSSEQQDNNDAIRQPLRFQGQYHDEETGLYYNYHRYYDPDIGRFITPDPIGLAGGMNAYQYAPNPTVWIDPMGLVKEYTGFVYRALTEPQYFSAILGFDIEAKNPNADFSHKMHVGGGVVPGGDHPGGQHLQTQFISTSKSLERAQCYDQSKGQIIKIDLSKIPDEAIKDISNGHGLKGSAQMWARQDQEVLINRVIPPHAYELLL